MYKLIINALIDLLIVFFIFAIFATLFWYDSSSLRNIYSLYTFWVIFYISFWKKVETFTNNNSNTRVYFEAKK